MLVILKIAFNLYNNLGVKIGHDGKTPELAIYKISGKQNVLRNWNLFHHAPLWFSLILSISSLNKGGSRPKLQDQSSPSEHVQSAFSLPLRIIYLA